MNKKQFPPPIKNVRDPIRDKKKFGEKFGRPRIEDSLLKEAVK